MHATVDDELAERQLQVLVEQGDKLRLQIVLAASVVGAVSWGSAAPGLVVGWVLAAVLLREWRAWAVRRLPGDASRPVASRVQAVVAWNAALGIVNGLAALFMLGLGTTQDALLTMLMISWGSASVATNSVILRAFYAFSAPMFGLVALMWVWQGGLLGWSLAVLVLVVYSIHIKFARRASQTFDESFHMRRDNLALANRLREERENLLKAKDVAETANLAKSRFLASASHDLRQPMQALALNSAALSRSVDLAEARLLAADMAESVDALRTMLDGLLDLSQYDTGRWPVRPRLFELRKLLDGLAVTFRAQALAKGLDLRLECPDRWLVDSDPELLHRLLANLVDNAVKYTQQGEVVLRAVADGGAGGVVVEVRDTGPGIAEQDHARIFDELVQLGNEARDRRHGYGLGLSIVRRLVDLLGLRIGVTSALGQGACFALHIPPAFVRPGRAPLPAIAPAPGPTAAALRGMRVLVLDDDEAIARSYARMLRAADCHALVAHDSDTALTLLQELRFDVALVDFRLRANDDGLVATQRLQEQQPNLAVVLCSADQSDALQARADALGVQLLRKPVDEATLLAALQQSAGRHASTLGEEHG